MDDFNKDFDLENGGENTEPQFENQPPVDEPQPNNTDDPNEQFVTEDEPQVWNKVNYTPVTPISNYKPVSKGLKVFCIVMAAVVLLTATTASGYFLGRNSFSKNYIGSKVTVDLESKPTDTEQNTPSQIYEKVNKSIVGIRVYNETGSASDASGVIYSKDGYIVTNDHIYSEIGAAKFKVFMYDGTEYDATYVAGDKISDLAVIKIDAKDLEKAEFGNSNELINGESVVAMGRPNDAIDSTSITGGMISLTRRRVTTTSNYSARLIQTDSAINPGSSGGALVNMYGQVVGITSSKLAGVEYDAVGFAIPTTTMKRVVEQLISNGKVTDRAKLGITYTAVNSVTAEVQNYDAVGLLVVSVSEDSDIYGKVNEGDFITHVNGIEITNDDIILDVIEDCKAGDTISLTVLLSNGTQADFNVTLKANVGDSSYSSVIEGSRDDQSSSNSSGETFNFPYGE